MERERWQQIEDLFHRCWELPMADRQKLLSDACSDDPAMRDLVEDMLESKASEGWIRDAVFDALPADAAAREKVGPYRVVRELGRGGMGVVLLAERDDDAFQMQVAIKLVEGRLPGSEIEQRLRQERQILARLDHPNIARLLDGGATTDGLPYFVMEHVEGEPIDRYCVTQGLSLRRRLELFHTLCGAVHYAHQRLVIHRDIKPSNILVTAEGAPKLLDFGVAKLLADHLDGPDPHHTATGVRLLTPDYASPEQIRGETLTTASDVYSLGVLLFRLLTGQAPYQFADRRPTEVERVICAVDPPAPSAAVVGSSSTELVMPEPDLTRRLAGDLDTIVLAAMHKDPARRYSSAEQLAEDIQRYLVDLPVRARPDTLRYRARKFFRRHRLAVLLSLTVALLLATASAITTWQARVAIEQRRQAEAESAKATTALDLLVDVFEVSDPGIARGQALSAREVLDQGAERILERLEAQPEIRLTLLGTIGRVYQNLGSYDQAARLFEEVLTLDRNAENLADLGAARFRQGRLTDARALFQEALAIQESSEESRAEIINDLAVVHLELGDLARAEALLREALQAKMKHKGLDDPALAEGFENLGVVLQLRNDLPEAEGMLRRALASHRMAHGDKHPAIASAIANLAGVLNRQKKFASAETLYREALAMRLEILDADHPDIIGNLLSLGSVLRELGQQGEAESVLRQAVAMGRSGGESGSLALAYSLGHLADLLRQRGRDTDHEEAEAAYRESLRIRRARLPSGHRTIANSLTGLARLMLNRGQCGTAEPLLHEASEIRQASLGSEHPATLASRELLAECQQARGGAPSSP